MENKSQPFKRRFRYYEVLGLSKEASQEEIKRAYLKCARELRSAFSANPDPKAQERMKKVNEAYEVLSNPIRRIEYDKAPMECEGCWTIEVKLTTGNRWTCRRCGHEFDPYIGFEIREQIRSPVISERVRTLLQLFQSTQCSWCVKFYTQEPMICPYLRLQSNCISFTRLDKSRREQLLTEERWWWRMAEMVFEVQERGILTRCTRPDCQALNPNPQKSVCWQCGIYSLHCPDPKCEAKPYLRYDTEKGTWKCPSAGCSKTYAIRPKKQVSEIILTRDLCPNCRRNLYFDSMLLLWKCKGCKRVYTRSDLKGEQEKKYNKRVGEDEKRQEVYSEKETKPQTPSVNRIKDKSFPLFVKVFGSLCILLSIVTLYYLLSYQTTYGLFTLGLLLIFSGATALIFWLSKR